MKKSIFKNIFAASIAAIALNANAAIFEYVGSFSTDGSAITYADGTTSSLPAPNWWDNPQVYSGVEAAALIFGGSSSMYSLSTVFGLSAPNGLAWYDGWGDHDGQQFADTYKLDLTGLGYNGCEQAGSDCYKSAYSAYVTDGSFVFGNPANYVYREVAAPVPEPETYGMMMAGLGLIGFMARRRKQNT